MKIVQVLATSGGMGGLEKHTLQLCNALSTQHDVHLIADASYQAQLNPSVQLHAINFARSRWNPFLIYEIIKKIKHIQPDILHAQASKASSLLAPWLTQLPGKKVATIHGMKNKLTPFLAFDHIVAVSGKIAKKFPNDAKIKIIWNGVDQSITANLQRSDLRHSLPIALAVGRLVEVKGFDVLVEAWQGLDAQLWIVGEGEQRPILESKTAGLGLQDKIKLLGYRDDVADLLQQVDCLIISSRKEGGPITLAEALLNHVPVLATDVGMVADFIDPRFICPENDVNALKQLLSTQLKLKAEMQPYFEHAFTQAQQYLHFQAMLEQTENLYSSLL
ncbi:glycosyltransferase [Acinetobacter towneri]|uniref:glycosyltransferase n=1 Tax=Acinetobacter towneri TaxID=202956 RepID=UPI003A8AB939